MRFSHWMSTGHAWDDLLARAQHAEATGWDGLWVADHFMANGDGPSDMPLHECFSVLAALAASVPRVRLGSLVAGNTYRHPAVLAKQAVTIDHVSGGRMVLGLGAGWQVNEHEAYGIEMGTVKERLAWFEEACAVVTGLRDQDRTTIAGERYRLTDAPLQPKPVGPFPLLIGSSGQKTMARIVAAYARRRVRVGEADALRVVGGVGGRGTRGARRRRGPRSGRATTGRSTPPGATRPRSTPRPRRCCCWARTERPRPRS